MNRLNATLAVPVVVLVARYGFKTGWPTALILGGVIGLPLTILNLQKPTKSAASTNTAFAANNTIPWDAVWVDSYSYRTSDGVLHNINPTLT